MMERAVLVGVAWADLLVSSMLALPWGKIALSFFLAAIIIKAVKYL